MAKSSINSEDIDFSENNNFEVAEVKQETAEINIEETSKLRKLTPDQLADKFEQLDGDYLFMRWRLAMLIRGKFKSDKLYGQWLIDFRTKNPSHVLSVTPQQTLNRYARAARFCDKFRIYDLRASGILPTSIYLMAKPENEEIVNERFLRQIKRRSLPVPEVERLLYQAKAIEGEFTEEAKPVVAEKVIVPPARSEELNMRVIDQAPVKHFEEEGQSVLSYPIENLSQDEIAYQILNYCEKFNLGSIKLVAVLQIAIKELQNQRYGKQVG